ncbi:chromosome segregation protein SMC [Idiomarina sp.]|uniref:chromosome segregation protein SMC n=1 Tax=Idiomarina sp. TaxID=1874361 RepID=UPI001D235557|nr:chromosome segregation protein SMC [Idiomarina sp.]MCJ8316560.1 chromosome segregation protein SMC [Idiomarina sp.]NQZ15283.1 chromosome segregation protein SMC [Idiomarina sp.]
MRLKHIKLVGFKSFVDPTKVPFPDQMTCVVGPNGCGKSNVIDAVRWVLGESSAKNLRGDAMTDVIFNGSNARKPVSQASVELVFDNSAGRIQGEYAAFNEISVKRLVTRDGQSNYFLNGSRCRRRDITDLFLGTGLGPRSYAIIEQGMISRLIESKPQELRVFIEEAAGISKYKERRRETENRMNHTRENLERLSDVREELGQQLDKLERQAAAAIRYKKLKKQERQLKGELQALRWLKLDNQRQQLDAQYSEQQAELEKWQAQQSGDERGAIELKERAEELRSQVEQSQEKMFILGNEVTRIEQTLKHQHEIKAQREERLQRIQSELTQLESQLDEDKLQKEQLAEQEMMLEPQLEELAEQVEEVSEQVQQADENYRSWQQQQRSQQQKVRDIEQQHQQAQLKEQQLQQSCDYTKQQLEQVNHQQQDVKKQLSEVSSDSLQREFDEASDRLNSAIERLQTTKQRLADSREQVEQAQEAKRSVELEQNKVQANLQAIEQLLIKHQSGDDSADEWLETHYPNTPRVRDVLKAEPGWELAVEQFLYEWLDAAVLESSPERTESVAGLKLIWPSAGEAKSGTLASKVSGALRHWPPLQLCAVADSDEQAQKQVLDGEAEFAVSKQGNWHWPNGFMSSRIDSNTSQLQLQSQCDSLKREQEELENSLETATQKLEQARASHKEIEQELEREQEQQQAAQNDTNKAEQQLNWAKQQQQQYTQQLERLSEQQSELEQKAEELNERIEEAALQREELNERLLESDAANDDSGDELERLASDKKEQLQALKSKQQQLSMQQQNITVQVQQLDTVLQRSEQRYQQLVDEKTTQQSSDGEENKQELEERLTELLDQRQEQEAILQEQRAQLSELEHELSELNQGQSAVQMRIAQAKEALQSTEIEKAKLQERSQGVLEGLAETGMTLKTLLQELPQEAEEQPWQTNLENVQNKIKRLGAINLAAIEEAEAQRERKQYLDQQVDDLSSSLETLETAIRKIDKETRHRFKTTFDAVNSDLQVLFPKVFGGGSASLELTDDDLLETGVTIMARPPGKKNSTIHLLSGGEKALTALSLVFAIFRLNPAPFCLLDEVDAPLDDANVGRFCRLVSEMSESVQFIYISHNKVAMEMASHLAGVTMQEAGVSRLVAVDVEQAVAMTEA